MNELEMMPETAGEHAKRADLPDIWQSYSEQAAKLMATARTVTVTDRSQVAEMKLARATRLALREVRLSVEGKRKELGEHHLREKQRIDSGAKKLKDTIEPLEARMELQETFIEREEAARRAERIASRAERLAPYCLDPHSYALGDMTDEAFAQLEGDTRAGHERRMAEAAKAAAEKAAADKAAAEERERLRVENERLRKEADAANEARNAAFAAASAERARREKDEALAAQQAAAVAAAKRAAANAPDKEKLAAFAGQLRSLALPVMTTPEGKATLPLITAQIVKFSDWLAGLAAKL